MRRTSLSRRTVFALLICIAALTPALAASQGVTTSALTGTVVNAEGQPIQGATVTATHLPSGTEYRATVTSSGRYNLPNLRVGGPYRIRATSIGYEPAPKTM